MTTNSTDAEARELKPKSVYCNNCKPVKHWRSPNGEALAWPYVDVGLCPAHARTFPSGNDKKLLAALKELLAFGVELDDPRLTYVVAQVDRNAITDAKALITEIERLK